MRHGGLLREAERKVRRIGGKTLVAVYLHFDGFERSVTAILTWENDSQVRDHMVATSSFRARATNVADRTERVRNRVVRRSIANHKANSNSPFTIS